MASNLYYNIKATIHFNSADVASLDPTVLAFHKANFGAVNIGYFAQSKSLVNKKIPLAQLKLNQVPIELITALNSNLYFIEINVSQQGVTFYNNFYNVVTADFDTSKEAIAGADLTDSNIILKSIIMNKLEREKTLGAVNTEVNGSGGFKKSTTLIFEKLPKILIDTYGSGFSVQNYCTENMSSTGYTDLSFPVNKSNYDNIEYMLGTYPFSLNPIEYGFDEGFDARVSKNCTELIMIDFKDPSSWRNQSTECALFEKDSTVQVQSQPIIVKNGNYFGNTFSNRFISCKHSVKNTYDNTSYVIDPEEVSQKLTIENVNGKFSEPVSSKNNNIHTEFFETTLSQKDYLLNRNAIISLYKLKPEIYTVAFKEGAPYDYFKLGRKSNLIPKNNNLTIASDIRFIPQRNPKNVQSLKEVNELEDPFLCTGEFKTLSY